MRVSKSVFLLAVIGFCGVLKAETVNRMYWTDAGSVYRSYTDGTGVQCIYSGNTTTGTALYVDLDPITGKLYQYGRIGNQDTGQGYVRRTNLDGTGAETLISSGINPLTYGFAIDTRNGTMYMGSGNGLRKANLDGTNLQFIPPYYPNHPYYSLDMEIDTSNNKFYYSDVVSYNGIKKANLDGTGVQNVLNLGGGDSQSTQFALDVANNRLFYTQYRNKTIGKINLDGSGNTTLLTGITALDIELDSKAGKMYWTTTNTIRRANLDGSGGENVVSLVSGNGIADSLALSPTGAVQWSTERGGNGHWYEVVYTPHKITWDAANSDATAKGGYLATITSTEENSVVYNLISDDKFWQLDAPSQNSGGPWLGGTRQAGSWQWSNGENWTYSNWGPGEPNGSGSFLSFWAYQSGKAPTWDDVTSDWGGGMYGYVVEYNALPEPSSLMLCGIGAAMAMVYALRRRASK